MCNIKKFLPITSNNVTFTSWCSSRKATATTILFPLLIPSTSFVNIIPTRFSRGSVQTTLSPNKKQRSGRLCSSFDDQIMDLQRDESNINEEAQQRKRRKRDAEESMQGLQGHLWTVKMLIVTHLITVTICE
ncbi:hypothetical protein I3843_08G082600 [Carya illinoinensis]|uniref:Uncharacterized protein n=1 Tax=Carya illinoinensis TaxID=32201 RepID=A0A922J9K1_CARIL|nr:structural maintenance of chromosomes protein 6A-like [Carya illinoinensis]KAG6699921.1 hypothetical protein I3842_08G086000 [Carya illinoinensis]KAG7967116.1 hypothetical protein I3843_08G082600 [Carya illinoinensis]